jgi:S1-C subfamily serine protease
VPRRHAREAGIENGFGAMIIASEPGGPASQSGLLTGDIVVRMDGLAITGVDDLIRMLNGERIGRIVTFDALRRGRLKTFEVTPVERRLSSS